MTASASLYGYWLSIGAFQSVLGFPLEDAVVPTDPTAPQSIRFEHGTLRWSPRSGAVRA